ncbi:MAG: phosphoserine phosphatase SerB [Pseudomonadota bacterium]
MVSSIARMLETTPHWLAPREACEFVGEFEKEILSSLLRDLRGDGEYDVIVLPDHNRQKKMLIADMDSTIITIECIDELADFMGIKSEVAAITNRAMAGELNFIDALRERVALLAGLKVSVIHEVCRERVELTPGARCLVQTMRASGAVTALVSGGFAQFTEYVADLAGFQYHVANRLETKGGVLTGHVDEPIRDSSAKLQTLLQISMNYGLKPQDILAVGDGANDLEMIKEAGIGCAYRAHAILRTNADIEINNTALTTALFAQGIERSSFAVN